MTYFEMENIHPQVKILLLESGWFEGRRIDTSNFRELAGKDGYVWFDSVNNFSAEFGNLSIRYFLKNGTRNYINFDLNNALKNFDSRWINDYAKRSGENLTVIGQAYDNHFTLMLSNDGSMYGGYDETFFYIEENGLKGIEAICLNREFKEL